MLTFDELRTANLERLAQAWPAEDPWQPWDWTNAITGEVGEACVEGLALLTALSAKAGAAANLTKKMNRVWPAGQFSQAWNKPEDQRLDELRARLAGELADVVIYADLLASKIGRSLGDCVRDKFNAKSAEIGINVTLCEAVLHGLTCQKKNHSGIGGYLHEYDDDSPYDVDNMKYCGRCHEMLS